MKNKKKNFFSSIIRYFAFLIIIFLVTIIVTKYYLYDSDSNVEETNLSAVSLNGIKLGMNIDDVDLSGYVESEEVVNKCNYNFDGMSIKTNSKGNIVYIIADAKEAKLETGKENGKQKFSRISSVWDELGNKYKAEIYNPEENNFWRICRYTDLDNKIYLGVVYSRYNDEIFKIILSEDKIK